MNLVILAGLCLCVGAWLGVIHTARRERRRMRAAERPSFQLAVQSTLGQAEMDQMSRAFDAYMRERGLDPTEDVGAIFADWLANRTGQTIIARQLDGDGLAIAMPDNEETDDG